MRAGKFNLTTNPQRFFHRDPQRGIIMIRNSHATSTIYLQGDAPSGTSDGFPILAGDVLTLERGDLSQEIWLWADVANDSNNILVA